MSRALDISTQWMISTKWMRAALAVALLAGCQVYDPALVAENGQCEGRRPPARPDIPDKPDGPEIIFGMRDVVLEQEADSLWSQLGYNLDGHCTAAPNFVQACQPAQGRASTDGVDGIDNTFGSELFPLVGAAVPGLEQTSRDHQLEGGGLVVVRIRGWNGEPNDPRVHVTITQSIDSVPAGPDEPPPELEFEDYVAYLPSGEVAPSPAWDGNDYTYVRADTFLGGNADDPLVYDNNAYIVDNVFVMKLPERAELRFQGDGVGVVARLTGAVATGKITDDRMRIEDVVVAGRWSSVDLLRTAEHVGICQGSPEYNLLRSRIDAFVDVTSSTDASPGTQCDAISVGVGFTGYRMRLGGLVEGPEVINHCDGMMLDGGM